MRLQSSRTAMAASGLVALALLGGKAVGAGDSDEPQPTIVQAAVEACEPGQAGKQGTFYPGPAASQRYEQLFSDGFALPHLATHVPQGITTWPKWNSSGDTILVISMYRKIDGVQYNSYLVAMDPKTGKRIGTVEVAPGHLGGIAIAGKYLFGQDRDRKAPASEPVRRYKLSRLADAFTKAQKNGSRPYLGRESGLQSIAGAGFMYSYDGEVWAGHFNIRSTDKVYRYKVSSAGRLEVVGAGYKAPAQTQGILVTSDRLIFNTSDGQRHGRMIVAERRHDYAAGKLRCFVTPSMGENLARIGDRVYTVYEGGSHQYPKATNRITRVHTTDLTKLRVLPPA